MPRAPRVKSESGFYHVVARGSGRQIIFEDDADRYAFLRTMHEAFKKRGVKVIAWCLMDNHVHIVADDPDDELSAAMHALLLTYARRFNQRTGHVGHVFQERFRSSAIAEDAYLLAAVRYVHDNPVRAGLSDTCDFPWSSYREYVSAAPAEFTDTGLVLDMLGGPEGVAELAAGGAVSEKGAERGDASERGRAPYVPADAMRDMDAAELAGLAREIAGDVELGEVKGAPRPQRDDIVRRMKDAGLSVRQIERLTGIGKSTISRI